MHRFTDAAPFHLRPPSHESVNVTPKTSTLFDGWPNVLFWSLSVTTTFITSNVRHANAKHTFTPSVACPQLVRARLRAHTYWLPVYSEMSGRSRHYSSFAIVKKTFDPLFLRHPYGGLELITTDRYLQGSSMKNPHFAYSMPNLWSTTLICSVSDLCLIDCDGKVRSWLSETLLNGVKLPG